MTMRPSPDTGHLSKPQVIGWREYVDLPAWGLTGVKAKADTGALTSAIDVADLQEIGHGRIRFDVVLSRNKRHRRVSVETPIVRQARVRSSLGHSHYRVVVEVPIRIGTVTKLVELGLVCRKNMICRMLLGRAALKGDFLVDPRRMYVFGRMKTRRKVKSVKHLGSSSKKSKTRKKPVKKEFS